MPVTDKIHYPGTARQKTKALHLHRTRLAARINPNPPDTLPNRNMQMVGAVQRLTAVKHAFFLRKPVSPVKINLQRTPALLLVRKIQKTADMVRRFAVFPVQSAQRNMPVQHIRLKRLLHFLIRQKLLLRYAGAPVKPLRAKLFARLRCIRVIPNTAIQNKTQRNRKMKRPFIINQRPSSVPIHQNIRQNHINITGRSRQKPVRKLHIPKDLPKLLRHAKLLLPPAF